MNGIRNIWVANDVWDLCREHGREMCCCNVRHTGTWNRSEDNNGNVMNFFTEYCNFPKEHHCQRGHEVWDRWQWWCLVCHEAAGRDAIRQHGGGAQLPHGWISYYFVWVADVGRGDGCWGILVFWWDFEEMWEVLHGVNNPNVYIIQIIQMIPHSVESRPGEWRPVPLEQHRN